MILELSDTCPILVSRQAEVHLHKLLYAITIYEWHMIAVPAPSRLKEILPPHIWTVYGEYMTQAFKRSANAPGVLAVHSDCGACDPVKMADYYSLPVVLIVENAQTDGAWFELVADKLRPRLARRMKGEHPSLTVSNAGGIGEIPKHLRRVSSTYQRARPDKGLPLRVVVMADSDARLPGQESDQARIVRHAAASEGADVHILRKRTIENYVPDQGLWDYAARRADARAAVRHITRLVGPARDHYPIKEGLTARELSQTDNQYLASPQLGIKLGDFISDYIANFGYRIDAHELKGRDGSHELDDLLDTVERNL